MYTMTENVASDFAKWKQKVDDAVQTIAGVSVDDLPDCPFWDWYEDDMKPATAARKALRYAME